MSIVLQQPQEALLAAEAGRMIGEAERAKREAQRSQEIADKLMTLKGQQELAILHNQIDIERQKFDLQHELEKEKRAKMWELTKMELRSQMAFAKEEAEREQKEQEYEAAKKYFEDNIDKIPPEQRDKVRFDMEMKRYGYTAVEYVKPKEDILSQILAKRMGVPAPTALQLGAPIPAIEPSIRPPSLLERIAPLPALRYLLSKKTVEAPTELPAIVPVRNQAEYDALPVGSSYVLPDGRQGIKR